MIVDFSIVSKKLKELLLSKGLSQATINDHLNLLNVVIEAHRNHRLGSFDIEFFIKLKNADLEFASARGLLPSSIRRKNYLYDVIFAVVTNQKLDASEEQSKYDFLQQYKSYLEGQGYFDSTIEGYIHKSKIYFEILLQQKYGLKDIKVEDVVNAIQVFAKRLPQSIHKSLSGIRLCFRWLKETKQIDEDFTDCFQIRVPKRRPLVKYFTKEQVQQLISKIDVETDKGILLHAVIALAIQTGLRCSDLVRLQLDNIDWKNKKLKLTQSKTQKYIEIPLMTAVAESLSRYLLKIRPRNVCNFIFISLTEPFHALKRRNISELFSEHRRKVFGEAFLGYGLHSIRRSLGSALFKNNIDVGLISEILGHSCIDSMNPYIQADIEDLRSCCLPLPSDSNGG